MVKYEVCEFSDILEIKDFLGEFDNLPDARLAVSDYFEGIEEGLDYDEMYRTNACIVKDGCDKVLRAEHECYSNIDVTFTEARRNLTKLRMGRAKTKESAKIKYKDVSKF